MVSTVLLDNMGGSQMSRGENILREIKTFELSGRGLQKKGEKEREMESKNLKKGEEKIKGRVKRKENL